MSVSRYFIDTLFVELYFGNSKVVLWNLQVYTLEFTRLYLGISKVVLGNFQGYTLEITR